MPDQESAMAEAVERALADAPPLTDEQADRIASILLDRDPDVDAPRVEPVVDERAEADRHAAAAQYVIRLLSECAVCGAPEPAHTGIASHPFVWKDPALAIRMFT